MKNLKKEEELIYDLAVIGGGPAGMMAAGRAAELGARVLLLEKNNRLGVKLLMTGHGRCNVTNNIAPKEFIKLISGGKFLYSSLHNFSSRDLMDFLERHGLELKTENNNRIFPKSGKSQDVLHVFLKYLETGGVKIRYDSEVIKIINSKNKITALELRGGETVRAKSFVVATGGQSYPVTGSSGDGYGWAKALGHRINNLRPGLTGIILQETYVRKLQGLSLKNVKVTILKDNKKAASKTGEAIFTGEGLSGPVIHDLSKYIYKNARFSVKLDFLPDLSESELESLLQDLFHRQGTKQLKNGLLEILPPKLVPVIVELSGIFETKPMNEILREEKKRLASVIKDLGFNVRATAGFDKANVTVGGIDLSEVNPKTMQSRIIDNLFFAGEILDLDGPTGGFNLQICWATGYAAGSGAVT